MKRSDFLAIIPALFVARKVKIEKPLTDQVLIGRHFKIKGKDLVAQLKRVEYSNLPEKQEQFQRMIKEGLLHPNEIRENED